MLQHIFCDYTNLTQLRDSILGDFLTGMTNISGALFVRFHTPLGLAQIGYGRTTRREPNGANYSGLSTHGQLFSPTNNPKSRGKSFTQDKYLIHFIAQNIIYIFHYRTVQAIKNQIIYPTNTILFFCDKYSSVV